MYKESEKITTKKTHACGGNNWTIIRVGADYKIKCDQCGRVLMLTKEKLDKIIKKV